MAKTKSSKSSKSSFKAIIDTVKVTNKSNGLKLRGFRKQNKMTQAEVGASIGRNSRTISQYETAYRAIPDKIIAQLNAKYSLDLKPVVTYDWDIKTGKFTVVKKSSKSSSTSKKSSKVSSKKISSTKVSSVSSKKTSSKASKRTSTFNSRFTSFYKSTGLSVVEFSSKYSMSRAQVYRIFNNVGKHYLSSTTLSKLSKDTDIVSLFK